MGLRIPQNANHDVKLDGLHAFMLYSFVYLGGEVNNKWEGDFANGLCS